MGKNITIKECTNRDEWDGFVAKRLETNFLQSFDFYEFHLSRGKKVIRKLFYKKDEVIAGYAGVIETAKRGRHLAVAGGPILNFTDAKLLEIVLNDMKLEATKQNCVFVRFRPQAEKSEQVLNLLKKLGAKKAPMYLSVEHAGILDLNKTKEEIMSGARQRLRRAIRKAEKAGVGIEVSTDEKMVEKFYQIQLETAGRQKFVPFSLEFLKKQFLAFGKNGEALIYSAKLDEEILAQNFMIFYGNEASYHYGVSSELGTKISAAPLLHFAAMDEARRRGIKRYNFWGIVDENDTGHRFYGVSEFKRGFGVAELKYVPAHDLVINKIKYQKTKIIELARKKHRHL